MGIYLYHPGYFDRVKQYESKLAPLRALVDKQNDPDWLEHYNRWIKLETQVERGYYCQWTSSLRFITGVCPEESSYQFTVEQMCAIRDRLAEAVKNPSAELSRTESFHWHPSADQIHDVAQWALEVFENGLRDNVLLYLA